MVQGVLDERRDLEILDAVGQVADVPQADGHLHDGAGDLTLDGEPAGDFLLRAERVFVAPASVSLADSSV